MTMLILAVLAASLLGSLHCAGMCGAFLAFAVGANEPGSNQPLLHVLYHGGRLVTYTLLGFAAGAAGGLANLAGALAGLQPIAAGLAGGIMVLFGLLMLVRLLGGRLPRLQPPPLISKLVQRGYGAAMKLRPPQRALTIGLLTTLLPCGWLYAFAVTAAGTGSAWWGGVVMSVFWLGTLPVMVSLGIGLQGALGVLGRRVPIAACLLLIIAGLLTLSGRLGLDTAALVRGAAPPSSGSTPGCCIQHDSGH